MVIFKHLCKRIQIKKKNRTIGGKKFLEFTPRFPSIPNFSFFSKPLPSLHRDNTYDLPPVAVGISRRVASFTFINAYYVRAIFKSCVNRNSHWH